MGEEKEMKEEYEVWFEIFGKKLKTTIYAESRADAEKAVRNRLIFHKIVKKDNETLQNLKNIFGI